MNKLINRFDLDGRRALVTGGGSGIGFSLAKILAEAGAEVTIAARTEKRLQQAAEQLRSETGARMHHEVVDLSRRSEAARLIASVQERMGGLDILVGNAGTESMEFVDQISDEAYDQIIAVNLTANVFLTKAAVPAMKKQQWGRIIFVTSTTAMIASKHVGHSIYSTSKSALHGFAKVAAVELGMDGITVNCLAPGITMTEMVRATINQLGMSKEEEKAFLDYNGSVTAVNRWAEPGEMAGALLLLASDAGSYISGETLVVDGGQTVVMDPVMRPGT